MRLELVAVMLGVPLCGCDPPIRSGVVVIPTPAIAADSSAAAIAILQHAAASSGFHAWAASDATEQRWVACHVKGGITVCAKRFDGETHMLLTARANDAREIRAVRVMLLDTLGARFGYAQVRQCIWEHRYVSRLEGCDTLTRDRYLAAFRDSLRSNPTRHPVDICPCIVALGAIPFLTPSLMALATRDTAHPSAQRRARLTLRVAGGLDQPKDTLAATTYSFELQYLTSTLLAEARQQEVDVPGAVRLRSLHLGPTFGDSAHIGAVTFGYRWMGGDAVTPGRIAGPEIGLPFIFLYRRWQWRMDASYVFSVHGTNWNYRLQQEYEARRHLLFGWKLETTSVPLRANN